MRDDRIFLQIRKPTKFTYEIERMIFCFLFFGIRSLVNDFSAFGQHQQLFLKCKQKYLGWRRTISWSTGRKRSGRLPTKNSGPRQNSRTLKGLDSKKKNCRVSPISTRLFFWFLICTFKRCSLRSFRFKIDQFVLFCMKTPKKIRQKGHQF